MNGKIFSVLIQSVFGIGFLLLQSIESTVMIGDKWAKRFLKPCLII